MFFEFSFSDKHLKDLKKNLDALYKLTGKLTAFSTCSFGQLLTLGKEQGIAKVKGISIHKKLNVDMQLDLYKFRLSKKYRCYGTRNLFFSEAMNLVFIDINHID